MSKSNSTSQRALSLVQTFVDAGYLVSGVSVEGRKISIQLKGCGFEGRQSVDAELQEPESSIDLLEEMRAKRAARNKQTRS